MQVIAAARPGSACQDNFSFGFTGCWREISPTKMGSGDGSQGGVTHTWVFDNGEIHGRFKKLDAVAKMQIRGPQVDKIDYFCMEFHI